LDAKRVVSYSLPIDLTICNNMMEYCTSSIFYETKLSP
jgi:hypothetical protein